MTNEDRIAQLEHLVDALAEIAVGAMNRTGSNPGSRWYHYMKREGGSRCIYYTCAGADAHFIVFDTLDVKPAEMRGDYAGALVNDDEAGMMLAAGAGA